MNIIHFFLHLDKYLVDLVNHTGVWSYVILFAVIFCETGLVVLPLLPGDSLLFAAGTLAARGAFDIHILVISLIIAAILGDGVNYWIGSAVGHKLFSNPDSKIFKKKYYDRTHEFYEKHGGKTIIIARFVPIIRTFAPFVAGVGEMTYWHFFSYNVIGAIIWVGLIGYASYFFGNIPIVKNNFSIVIVAIIIISVLPGFVEYFRYRLRKG